MNEMASTTGFPHSTARSLAAAIVVAFCATIPLSPARAFDDGTQTQASREQVEKLIGLFHQHYDNAHSLLERRAAFRELMEPTPEPTRIQIRHVDADGVEA